MMLRVLVLVALLQFVAAIDTKEFVTIGDHRYYFSASSADRFSNAIQMCNDVNAALLSLETEEEYLNITAYINDVLNTRGTYYWTSGGHVSSGWTWTGVSRPMSYTRWAYTEPSESGREKQACVYIINGLMYDTICSYPDHYFICEENCPTKSRDINVDDAKDLVNLGGRDYYFSLFTDDHWNAAAICDDMNMAVMSLETAMEHTLVVEYLRSIGDTNFYWTSGMFVYDQWTWSATGMIFTYANWAPGFPSNTNTTLQSCAYLHASIGYLYDIQCYHKVYVACEQRDC